MRARVMHGWEAITLISLGALEFGQYTQQYRTSTLYLNMRELPALNDPLNRIYDMLLRLDDLQDALRYGVSTRVIL